MQYPATKPYDENGLAAPLEVGNYKIRLKEVQESDQEGKKFIDKNNNQYVRFVFEVSGHDGNLLFDRFCFDEKALNANVQLGKFKQMQIAMGVDTDKPGDTKDLIGLKCMAYVTQRPYNGKTYNDIKRYFSLDSDEATTPAPPNSGPADDDLPF